MANTAIRLGYISLSGGGSGGGYNAYTDLASFPPIGVDSEIYLALDTNKIYKWDVVDYVEISPSEVISVNTQVGDVVLDKSDIGLDQVDNTSDADKPISDATQGALDVIDGRIVPIEERSEVTTVYAYENNAAVSADGEAGIKDPSALIRDGWYFKNSVAGQKINWYYFDGTSQGDVTLGDFTSAYAVMTFDAVSGAAAPILAVYTFPTGTGDALPGFAHSRIVYDGVMNPIPEVGKQYLVYAGENPPVHPNLPRINLPIVPSLSIGEKLPTEQILTVSFGSSSGAGVNQVQFMVETLGLFSDPVKHELDLRIRVASQLELDTHEADFTNPHQVTKDQVGLGNVDNTSDADKPVSTATQTALDGKSEVGDNVSDFVNDAGYITSVSGGDHTTLSNIGTNSHAQIDSHIGSTLNPHSVTKTQVGLGNADNTSDLDKPISTATQTALDGKQTNPFGVCKIERTGTFYATFAAAITDMQDYDTLIKLSGNHQAQAMDFTSSGLSNITIFARGSSGTANNIVGNVFLDSTCTNFEFHNIDIIATASDSLADTGSVGSSFNECRIDRNSGSVAVRISGASASGVRFSNCVINKDISLNGTNFSGFITVIQCTVDDIIGTNNQGAFIDYTLINSSLQVAAASYLEVRNTIVPYIKSTQTNMGFPTFVLSNVQVRDPAAAQSSQIIEKTGTARYSLLDVKYKIVGSTTNGTNDSNAFPVNYAYNLMGKTGTALSALTRVAGMLHHNKTSTRPNWDDGTTLNELAYTSDAITTHSGLTLDDGTNPHGTTKADVGLGNVDNTSDADKPISTAVQTALNLKEDAIGYTPEDVANKSTDTALGSSDTLYPTQNAVKAYTDTGLSTKINTSEKGAASGVAPLNSSAKIDALYLPSYVDDVEEYANLASFPVTGETGKIYIALDTNLTYRWSGSVYVEISPAPVISVNGQTNVVVLDSDDLANQQAVPAYWDVADGSTIKAHLDELVSRREAQNNVTNEPTGFATRNDSVTSFTDSTPDRTFTIAPTGSSFDFYVKGVKFTKTSAESIQIPNLAGNHFIYYSPTGVLSSTQAASNVLFKENALLAIVYWNTDTNTHSYFAEERHGLTMDGETHSYLHTVFGAQYLSGLALQGFIVNGNGSLDTHAQFTADEGTIRDEDLLLTLPAQTQIPVLYRQGTLWRKKAADAFPMIYSGTAGYTGANGRLPYNELISGSWQLTEVANNSFVLVHLFGTNDKETPIVAIQGVAEYGNVTAARLAASTEITSLSGLPFAEFVALGSVVFETADSYTNTPKAVVRSVNGGDYVDFRGTQLYSSAGVATSHGLLSGLSNDDHIQYHTDARGDIRYYTKAQVDSLIGSAASPGDINEQNYSFSNSQATPESITGLVFSNAVVRSFKATVSVSIDADSNIFEVFEINGIQKDTEWDITINSAGDVSDINFSITTSGQIQYTSANYTGFVTGVMKFRALTTSL